MQKKIDFLIIGSAKCATTSFHYYLGQHPDIYMPFNCGINHESGYFLKPGSEQIKGLTNDMIRKDVAKLFEHYQGERLVGERSTDYTKFPFRTVNFEKIKSHNPQMKFLYFVSDPEKKLKKLYFHHLKNKPEQTLVNFEKELEETNGYYERISSYYYQIQFYYNYFAPQNIRIINIDAFDEHPGEILSEIFSFLNVSHHFVNTTVRYNVNKMDRDKQGDRITIPSLLVERLREDYSRLIALARESGTYIA